MFHSDILAGWLVVLQSRGQDEILDKILWSQDLREKHICICTFLFVYLYLYICTCIFVYLYLCICICILVFVYLYLYICIFWLVYLYICICIFVFGQKVSTQIYLCLYLGLKIVFGTQCLVECVVCPYHCPKLPKSFWKSWTLHL